MDERQFDTLARVVARSGSRRGILRGLAGAGALLAARRDAREAAAHHGKLGPGDSCRTDAQCLAADAPLICADNGFTFDGPLNCCTYEGSRCGFDQGCCGEAACVDGFCASTPVSSGPGDPCQDSSRCVAADTALTCEYNGRTDDYRCCAYEGGRCGWDGGCCGWLRCTDNGFCTSDPPSGCDGEGCDCDFHDPNACAPGLVCCAVQSDFICATWANCGG